jgi:ribulose-phosphate 3-epimerase
MPDRPMIESTSPAGAAPPGERAPPVVIAPSLLSCDFARIADEVRRVEDAGADWLHVDVMDGHFVPNLTIGPPVIERVKRVARCPLDVHLMISDPVKYARAFVAAGAWMLTFHWEVAATERGGPGVAETVRALRAAGAPRVGVAINPDAPVEPLEPHLGELDLVLVMSVFPGFGGQKFMPDVLRKTAWLRQRGYRGHVEMDGGLNAQTLPECAAAGANALVAGSAVFGSGDLGATIGGFRRAAEAARSARGRER